MNLMTLLSNLPWRLAVCPSKNDFFPGDSFILVSRVATAEPPIKATGGISVPAMAHFEVDPMFGEAVFFFFSGWNPPCFWR